MIWHEMMRLINEDVKGRELVAQELLANTEIRRSIRKAVGKVLGSNVDEKEAFHLSIVQFIRNAQVDSEFNIATSLYNYFFHVAQDVCFVLNGNPPNNSAYLDKEIQALINKNGSPEITNLLEEIKQADNNRKNKNTDYASGNHILFYIGAAIVISLFAWYFKENPIETTYDKKEKIEQIE